jgi:predicted nucleotidyltransferase
MVNKPTNNKIKIIKLYKSDYLEQYHIREMGKLIKKSHVTLLPHIKSLEKENILIPKISGKNKYYILNLDNVITKNHLLISEIFDSINLLEQVFLIKKIYTEIITLNLLGTIILFGSYANKSFNEDSDIDLFYIGDIFDKEKLQIKKIGETYGKIVNIKKTTLKNFELGLRKKEPLIIEIIKNHILLQNSEQFINALWKYYNEIRR